MAVENGMIVGAERYDIQYQDEEKVQCCCCEEMVLMSECVEFGDGDIVCEDCVADYLVDRSDDYVDDYIEDHSYEYYKEWRFDNMAKKEQLETLEMAYQVEERLYSGARKRALFEDRKAFCLEDDGFLDSVQKELGGKEKWL